MDPAPFRSHTSGQEWSSSGAGIPALGPGSDTTMPGGV
jgi:hypothetical protein